MTKNSSFVANMIGLLLLLGVGGVILYGAMLMDRRQRELVAGGHYQKQLEALYTPPPTAHTSCSGDDSSRHCTTWYSQPAPYMRSLWRCTDPSDAEQVEFWRPSVEEFER